ncbi:putative acylesterase/phospholipase RssA [Desulfitispora alkaliphila]|uniref:patatin-like phospholipase family protein n=1 Tax=Desulfitispora alkaliphila TaxID=622674 RepID=UPI003D25FF36
MKLGVAFSGGGLKGVAHLGVLEALADNRWLFILWNIRQRYIDRFSSQFFFNYSPLGILTGNRFESWLKGTFGDVHMSEITTPLAITAVDIKSGKLILFCSKSMKQLLPNQIPYSEIYSNVDLATALRASTSLPAVFAPKKWGSMDLIDGGVINNLPVNLLHKLNTKTILAVDLSTQEGYVNPENILEVAASSIDLMLQANTRSLASKYATIVLKPQTGKIPLWDFAKADYLYQVGYDTTMENIKRIKASLKK